MWLVGRAGVGEGRQVGERARVSNFTHLVLKDNDVLQLHYLHRCQVLTGLRLRASLIAGNEKKSGIHHSRSVEHRGHENIVARTRGREGEEGGEG